MKDVAIVIDNMVQFFSIRDAVDSLVLAGRKVDVYVPEDSGYNGLSQYAAKAIRSMGYPVRTRAAVKNSNYKVLLEPYVMQGILSSIDNLRFQYRIKFEYALISAKPNPVYLPEWNIAYDAVLVYSRYEQELLQAYTKTHRVLPARSAARRQDFVPARNRKRLLYLPTFEDMDPSVMPLLEKGLTVLKRDYVLIIKAHHATQFRSGEVEHHELLKRLAEEYYDQSTPLVDIMSTADVVLSGNSAATFDAIYAGIPVSIYTDDVNKHRLGGVDTFQSQLVHDGVVPFARSVKNIPDVLVQSIGLRARQQELKNQQFGGDVPEIYEVVEQYIDAVIEVGFRGQLRSSWIEAIGKNRNELHKQTIYAEAASNRVRDIESSTSWRITAPLRLAGAFLHKLKK